MSAAIDYRLAGAPAPNGDPTSPRHLALVPNRGPRGEDNGAAHRAVVVPLYPPRPTRPTVRLTRRGVAVVAAAVVLVATGIVLLAWASAPRIGSPTPTLRSADTVIVHSGDTLWSIAERVAPRTDPRATVAAIERANGLHGASVAAGDRLVLPAGR